MARELILPDDFDEYAWEVEAKGYFSDAFVRVEETVLPVVFYEPTRLAQDVAEEIFAGRTFAATRLLVVAQVTEAAMRRAVAQAPPGMFW